MSFVLDTSVAVAWLFEDEASAEADALAARVAQDGAMTPSLWRLEVANVLLQAEKRGRIAASDVALRLELLDALPIATDAETDARSWRETLSLARQYRLTSYDAAYLELAMRKGVALATRDRALIAAARSAGVAVI